ncbi:hypothetical protein [Cupriavidus basilensis]|uniref:hypothetical protein n=1 Tax=Cupriavidus basilensis TaxID=68895 RepID=UPI0023E88578|nr:hypothetical protein [Cupriavidus basilensis]MDF3887011.1 hypothetical protein [Cupriavidus basilensis]
MKTEITFHWRKRNLKESILAVCYAVRLGYTSRDQLLSALPQFSKSRILLSLDALFSANMADVNMGVLSINSDMAIVEEIIGKPIVLPIPVVEDEDKPKLIRRITIDLGLNNPAGVETLLKATVN